MVFPLGDDNIGRRCTPYVTLVLIALNVIVFVVFQRLGDNENFTNAYSAVPGKIMTGNGGPTEGRIAKDPTTGDVVRVPGLPNTPIPVYLTLLTSMFMHGSLMHIAGNMWFLWIFGDNVEDDLGPERYLGFYLVCGIIAGLAHVLTNQSGTSAFVPSLGASGAISGVLAAYVLVHPKRQVRVILFQIMTNVPAYVAIGIWFGFQLFQGILAGGGDGVAYAAHIGGFIAGLVLIKPLLIGREPVQESSFFDTQ